MGLFEPDVQTRTTETTPENVQRFQNQTLFPFFGGAFQAPFQSSAPGRGMPFGEMQAFGMDPLSILLGRQPQGFGFPSPPFGGRPPGTGGGGQSPANQLATPEPSFTNQITQNVDQISQAAEAGELQPTTLSEAGVEPGEFFPFNPRQEDFRSMSPGGLSDPAQQQLGSFLGQSLAAVQNQPRAIGTPFGQALASGTQGDTARLNQIRGFTADQLQNFLVGGGNVGDPAADGEGLAAANADTAAARGGPLRPPFTPAPPPGPPGGEPGAPGGGDGGDGQPGQPGGPGVPPQIPGGGGGVPGGGGGFGGGFPGIGNPFATFLQRPSPEQLAFAGMSPALAGLAAGGGLGAAAQQIGAQTPIFQRNLQFAQGELANRAPSTFNTAFGNQQIDLTSRALDDFNRLAANAIQTGQQTGIDAASTLLRGAGLAGRATEERFINPTLQLFGQGARLGQPSPNNVDTVVRDSLFSQLLGAGTSVLPFTDLGPFGDD